jgi:15-cis-phytoene synthase
MSSPPRRRSATAISPDQELALLHVPAQVRDALRALFEIDAAMGDVVARTTDPALGRIKLAWWREQLEALDSSPPPAEPRLQGAAEHLLPLGVKGSELAGLESGCATLLDPEIDIQLVAGRGGALFRIGSKLLGASDARIAEAGALYALASAGRWGLPELFGPAAEYLGRLRGHRFDRRVRPLTMLARAAARDLHSNDAQWDRRRALAMLAHRWTGYIG